MSADLASSAAAGSVVDPVRALQHTLYRSAKADPGRTRDWADNTYSDGRSVLIQARIEPEETSEWHWGHNRFLLGDGAVNEHPRGTVSVIAPLRREGVS